MRFSFHLAHKPGLLLGIAMTLAGAAAIAFTPSHTVDHGPVMRQPHFGFLKSTEKVSPPRARFYGAIGVAGGVFLSLLSLYVPRPREPGKTP